MPKRPSLSYPRSPCGTPRDWVNGPGIHTPPPPPNQIVHVRLAEGFKVKSRFQPVTVTGRLSNGDRSANLYLVDGSADIKIGYTMEQA
jgi:hypothetical protein